MAYTSSDYSQAPDILRNFIYYMLTIKGRSQLTVENYYLDLRFFFRYLKRLRGLAPKNVPLREIDISDVDIKLIETMSIMSATMALGPVPVKYRHCGLSLNT